RRTLRGGPAVQRRALAGEQRAREPQAVAERGATGGGGAEVREAAVTAADAEEHAAARHGVHRRGGAGGDRRVARGEIGDAGREADALGTGGGEGERDAEIHGVARRVGDAEEIPAVALGRARHAGRVLGGARPEAEAEARRGHLTVCPADPR